MKKLFLSQEAGEEFSWKSSFLKGLFIIFISKSSEEFLETK